MQLTEENLIPTNNQNTFNEEASHLLNIPHQPARLTMITDSPTETTSKTLAYVFNKYTNSLKRFTRFMDEYSHHDE